MLLRVLKVLFGVFIFCDSNEAFAFPGNNQNQAAGGVLSGPSQALRVRPLGQEVTAYQFLSLFWFHTSQTIATSTLMMGELFSSSVSI